MPSKPTAAPVVELADDSKSRLRLWLRLLSVSRMVEGRLRENLRTEFASTLPRFDVMSALARYPNGIKMTELSAVLRVSNGNITGLIDRLVDEGFAKREAVPGDRRAHCVLLTKDGYAQFTAMATAHAGWISELFEEFDEGQSAELSEVLKPLQEKLSAR